MKTYLLYFLAFFAFGCKSQSKASVTLGKSLTDSTQMKYRSIIRGLNGEYVLYYCLNKSIGINVSEWGMPESENTFKEDSTNYWSAYSQFFVQDTGFIKWLLAFKQDTARSGLWVQYHNPVSSHLSECHLGLNNSRAAIILLQNFLEGYNEHGILECFPCAYNNREKCSLEKFAQIEAFVARNKGRGIEALRKAWKTQNYR